MKINEEHNLYNTDIAIVKDYKIKKKLTLHRTLRKKGFEIEKNSSIRGTINDEKIDNSIIRTRGKIFELSYCNSWEHFITLTIDQKKYDRHDLKKYHKDLSQWLRDYSKKHDIKIKYLLIPEMHKDGSWHMHGFIMGLPGGHLIKNEHGYKDWIPYRKKFGYCSIDEIKNHDAVSKYVTKYISKDLQDCIKELNANMYYCSQGLDRAIEIKRGILSVNNIPYDFKNEYVAIKWLSNDNVNEILNNII